MADGPADDAGDGGSDYCAVLVYFFQSGLFKVAKSTHGGSTRKRNPFVFHCVF